MWGLSWALLLPAWGQLGFVWGDLGPVWISLGRLEAILKPFWKHLEGILRPFWGEGGASLRQFSDRTGLGTLALHRPVGNANHMGLLSLATRVFSFLLFLLFRCVFVLLISSFWTLLLVWPLCTLISSPESP